MFPRKKKNRTGTISVVVVDKSRGGFKEVKSFGVAKTEEEADRLYVKAAEWVRRYGGQQEIDFAQSSIVQQEFLESERVLNNISAVVLNGPQQILNQVYDSIGFGRIRDEVLRHLVIARICQPLSKSATADYLKSYFHEDISLDQIYRYMDKLYNRQRELVQQISVEHTRKILGGSIGLRRFGAHHRLLRCHFAVLRNGSTGRVAHERILKGRQDVRVSDNPGTAGQCGRLSAVVLHLQRCAV